MYYNVFKLKILGFDVPLCKSTNNNNTIPVQQSPLPKSPQIINKTYKSNDTLNNDIDSDEDDSDDLTNTVSLMEISRKDNENDRKLLLTSKWKAGDIVEISENMDGKYCKCRKLY